MPPLWPAVFFDMGFSSLDFLVHLLDVSDSRCGYGLLVRFVLESEANPYYSLAESVGPLKMAASIFNAGHDPAKFRAIVYHGGLSAF